MSLWKRALMGSAKAKGNDAQVDDAVISKGKGGAEDDDEEQRMRQTGSLSLHFGRRRPMDTCSDADICFS